MHRQILKDGKNLVLNSIVRHIPSWTLRRICYKYFGMKIGNDARIGIRTYVLEPEQIVIGERSIVNSDCMLDGRGGIVIEHDVSISQYTKIITGSHKKNSGTFEYYTRPVLIQDHVWVGVSAIILLNSKIGKNAIIGAGCVFKGTCNKNAIMIGNPAKKIGDRELEDEYVKDYKTFFI